MSRSEFNLFETNCITRRSGKKYCYIKNNRLKNYILLNEFLLKLHIEYNIRSRIQLLNANQEDIHKLLVNVANTIKDVHICVLGAVNWTKFSNLKYHTFKIWGKY